MKIKQLLAILMAFALVLALVACDDTGTGGEGGATTPAVTGGGGTPASSEAGTDTPEPSDFDTEKDINVYTREDGSGTRSAFIDIVGLSENDTVLITEDADIINGTGTLRTAVANNEVGIGYISYGAKNDEIKVLNIDGVAPSAATMLDETYKLQRPFNLIYKGELSDSAQDFWNFIFSIEGQKIITDDNLVQHPDNADAKPFESNKASGTITVGGSTSINDIMVKLREAYNAHADTAVTVMIEGGGSGTGETSTVSGVFDIGMVSREVRAEGVEEGVLAIDGIVVIVNKANPLESLTMDELKGIYLGEIEVWAEVID